MNRAYYIYGLYDAEAPTEDKFLHITYGLQGHVRYVGQTINLKRLLDHIREAFYSSKCTHRLNWLRTMLDEDRLPEMFIIDKCSSKEEMDTLERTWIREYRLAGHRLTNGTNGGNGTLGHKPSAETLVRMSDAHKGKKISDETRAKLSAAGKREKLSDETRKKRSAAQKGKKHTDEARAKMSAVAKGRKHSNETRERMSTVRKGRKAWNKGLNASDEVRVKMRVAHLKIAIIRMKEKLRTLQ